MSLDTKYRPHRYEDVLGNDATITICKEIVRKEQGFQQSYVFGGSHGSGKTTLGRILARALLCSSPEEGDPCDECHSCKSLLAEASEDFIEVDAATNSGKEDIRRITEEAQFGSFSGKRKIYLLDESHELSRQAMDALLKPLEDNIRGTQDKQLICIFCTTEVEKMRPAILSRCAPVFRIRANTAEEIAKRLSYICEKENIDHDPEVLPVIAEVVECHIRDAIKAVEGVVHLGTVSRENVLKYLQMDANDLYLDILENLGSDISHVLKTLEQLSNQVSPSTSYRRLADLCMMAYRLAVVGSANVPSYWNKERIKAIGEKHREFLVSFGDRMSRRPMHATASMLVCDIATLHQERAGIVVKAAPSEVIVPVTPAVLPKEISSSEDPLPEPIEELPKTKSDSEPAAVNLGSPSGRVDTKPLVTTMGVYVNPLAQNVRRQNGVSPMSTPHGSMSAFTVDLFTEILQRRVIELTEEKSTSGRPARWDDVGSS